MMNGYVIAGYLVSFVAIVSYTVRALMRRRALTKQLNGSFFDER